jgi:F-type H+-transporting ATPase subunit b
MSAELLFRVSEKAAVMRRCPGLAAALTALLIIMACAPGAGAQEEGHDQPAQAGEAGHAGEVSGEDAATDAGHQEPAHQETGGGEAGHAADSHSSGPDAHHDPFDLSHNDATASLEDPKEFRSDLAIWTFVVFLCLLGLLLKFAWGPIMAGLEKREQSIATMIDGAKQRNEEAAEQLRQYQARLAAAGEEAQKVLLQAQREAESNKEQIIAEAQSAARRERDRAVADIESAKSAALEDITQRSVDLAVLMAGRIVQRQLEPEDQAQLIRDALEQLPSQN